eukprot:TRINITY_DN6455_c0_g1_i13.p1 TRINITY_DN6455_c0_g1~~TRINITY_DN6455_c0_g1_i13.p1  ORF type:complete len:266 (-),score=41.35 TRINITY_DN6455_c0_g1_i13:164-961(-)
MIKMSTFGLLGNDSTAADSDSDSDTGDQTTFGLFGSTNSEKSEDKNEEMVAPEKCENDSDNSTQDQDNSDQYKSKTKGPKKFKNPKWNRALDEVESSTYVQYFVASTSSHDRSYSNSEDFVHHETSSNHSKVASREECAAALSNALDQHKRFTQQLYKNDEDAERIAHIYEIKTEIEEQRQQWEPLYSDEESDQIEVKAKKRKKAPKSKASRLVQTVNGTTFAEDGSMYAKGERWKRLKLIAETKVKNDPEKYSSIRKDYFPLRP